MKRFVFNPKIGTYEFKDWTSFITQDYGPSCVKKNKYVEDKVRINNNEVSTGSSRTALYTMPGGVDTGVRYSALYESSGLDITEIEANKNIIKNAKNKAEDMIKEEFDKISTETVNKISQKSQSSTSTSQSNSSE